MMNVTNNIDLGEKVSVDISEIPSGLYLYKLQRGDFSKSGKILIRRYY